MMRDLEELGRLHGIVAPPTPEGVWTAALSQETQRAILSALGVRPEDEGALTEARALDPVRLAAPPEKSCFVPEWLDEAPAWGVAVQLYELRSHRNWGIGDFADLAALAPVLAKAGADFIGLNPLHALFGADPTRASPFSPSNRRFWNPLYIAVDRVDGFSDAHADEACAAALRDADRVDYAGVAALKIGALHAIWTAGGADAAFEAFVEDGGEALRLHCLFEAISSHMAACGAGAGWTGWPAPYYDRDGPAVAEFADTHADEIRFHQWLQYLCDRQLGEAQAAARNAGMRIGLYLDLAVAEAPDGSATWSRQQDYTKNARVGAPPDFFTAEGQDWGLSAISPLRVRQTQAAVLEPTYAAAMRHAGAVRLDHAMGIWQLFLIPDGMPASRGAYARLPTEDVIAMLADISTLRRTILVGEDLGVVPEGFRDVLAAARILSYRVLYFEQGEDGFTPAGAYPSLALACIATHDLPTMRGWWKGLDIDLRERFELIDAQTAHAQRVHRMKERGDLLRAVGEAASPSQADEISAATVVAAHRFIASTPSRLAVARLADLAGEEAPTNVPGTSHEYPNWQLKCTVQIEKLADTQLFCDITAAMAAERPRRR